MADWRVALLKSLGYKPTKQNMRFLGTWQRWEGGHTNNDAQFNWLNTTRDAPGAVGSINSVGVKRFRSFQDGIAATVSTLKNGRYQDILKALASGNPYKVNPSAGLQTWVSGSPYGNAKYAAKILGGPAGKYETTPTGPTTGFNRSKQKTAKKLDTSAWDNMVDMIFKGDRDMISMMKGLNPDIPLTPSGDEGPTKPDKQFGTVTGDGFITLPTKWKSTHPTSGLENEGFTQAIDIMGAAGTQVGAPEDAVVVYWHPTGAQGGGSMLLRTPSGREYWVGHIANGVKAGTRVRRGQRIADISSDHANPHVHLDKKG